MEDFVNLVNWNWSEVDTVALASFVRWRLNFIHPFINDNGRTARAACYFVLCLHIGHWLPGQTILPELIRRKHADYVAALQAADASHNAGAVDLSLLHALDQIAQKTPLSAGFYAVTWTLLDRIGPFRGGPTRTRTWNRGIMSPAL